MNKIKDGSLYLVISSECCNGRSAPDIVRHAVAGGVDIVQMREKNKPKKELLKLGREFARICREGGAIFIVNDDPVLAVDTGADGVHIGQEDIKDCPIDKARSILGRDRIIGVSTNSLIQFEKANADDVDYIAYGPVFKTKTKDYFVGTSEIGKIAGLSQKPVFFIGGIDLSNVGTLLDMGVRNVAMIRAITESCDVAGTVRKFKRMIEHDNKNKR